MGEKLNISAAHVLGVVTFYPGLRQMCPGKPHPRMPHSSCAMAGRTTCSTPSARVWALTKTASTTTTPFSQPGRPGAEGVECLVTAALAPT
ncbi:MAG: hypothetical protein ACLSUW_04845 [Akkermansia sp.]